MECLAGIDQFTESEPMSESLANLHVVGVTLQGSVFHTMRSPGGWTPFTVISAPPLRAIDVACVRRRPIAPEPGFSEGLWILIAFENAPPQLLFRNTAGVLSTIPTNILPLPTGRRVAVTVSPGEAPQNDPFSPGAPRSFVHLVVIADGATPQDRGRLIAAIMPNRGAGGVSSPIAEIQTSGAGDLGAAAAVALAPANRFPPRPAGEESIASAAVAFDDGALFFTEGGVTASGSPLSSGSFGRWAPFRARDLVPPGGPGGRPGPTSDVALVTNQAVASTRVGIVRGGPDPDIYGTSASGGAWTPWENLDLVSFPGVTIDVDPGLVRSVAMSETTEGLHVLGVVSTGQIFHQLRTAPPSFAIFQDVEMVGVGAEVGHFVEVACG